MTEVKVDLAHEPDFAIGPLMISPSRRELSRDGLVVTLEHRVMQVLIALHRANAAVAPRDDLIAACWEGRFVSDDAINQVISRLRRALFEVGGDVLAIETLSKIGYRLYRCDTAGSSQPKLDRSSGIRVSRRAMIAGWAGLAGAAALGGLGWRQYKHRPVSAEIDAMMDQSRQLLGQNTREGQYQGIGILRSVVEREPDFADGWGRLGIAYGIVSHYRDKAEGVDLRRRAEAAANRSLEIDPDNALGEMALSVALPFIGHFLERERHQNRALALDPRGYDTLIYTAVTQQFVGRNKEAVRLYKRLPNGPLTPADHNNLLRALWSAGHVEEADQEIARAVSLYPTQSTLWLTKLQVLLYSGRHKAAIAVATDLENAPSGANEQGARNLIAMAQALESRDQIAINRLMAQKRVQAAKAGYLAENAIRDACALGRTDDAFALADAYYFSHGFQIPDADGPDSAATLDQRQTRFLFEPVCAPMRRDPRFGGLMRRLKFDAYWKASGHLPDHLEPA